MRLSRVDTGLRWSQRLLLGLFRLMFGSEALDVVKVFMYRPQYFGQPFCLLGDIALRNWSPWSIGERELFGAFTSSLNRCAF